MDPDVLSALRQSTLGDLPLDRLEALVRHSRIIVLAHGAEIVPEGEHPPPLLIVEGLIRIYRSAPDGRRVTVRYARRSELLAITYTRMGLLDPRTPANWFDPGRFWSGDRLELLGGASLGPEIAVTGSAVPVVDA